ncbi:DUF192 domain-containing protein [Methylobrevis sp. L22]|uniref:DUF192 domain-containing protein n=2 Tax=Methylobrevis albus TaxID=2793297 RepID=A0A931I4P3_9HYPH|nr:DUF192 domain-containing protein [Methylobrevis albus]
MSRHSLLVRAAAVAALLVTGFPAAIAPRAQPAAEAPPPAVEQELSPLVVVARGAEHRFEVELVDTPETRSVGLMYRRSLAPDRGMLFDMERTGEASFWMKDTYVSLDIIFIDIDGRVVRIAADTTPLSERPIMSGAPVRFVLELVAGTAAAIGLQPGDVVRHDRIAEISAAEGAETLQ